MLRLARVLIHLSCLAPLVWLTAVLMGGDESVLGADPVKEIEHFLGYTAIIIFCVMFLLGIVLQALHKNQYQVLRRPLGLWAFFWAMLHVTSYFVLELGLDTKLFASELLHRPYLILGAVAFTILLIMTVTSLPAIKQKLGKHWFQIHQWAYPAIICAAIHYYWSVKGVTLAPILIGGVVGFIVTWKFMGDKILSKLKR